MVAGRTLAKADLESYLDGGFNEAAIITQVVPFPCSLPMCAWGGERGGERGGVRREGDGEREWKTEKEGGGSLRR